LSERTSFVVIACKTVLAASCVRPDAIVYCVPHHLIVEGRIERKPIMAREKPLDLATVQTWLSAWNESDVFSDAAVRHLQSLITDPFCLVVVTLGIGREPRSLVFRRRKRMLPPPPWPPGMFRRQSREALLREAREHIEQFRSMPVGPVAPVAPSVGQLWHQTGVKSETVPKKERVLRWDGAEWVIAGLVVDDPEIGKQGKQVCDFMEALTYAHGGTKWGDDCEFIYTYDGSTWGNA
jgi:hypothetical protein